jgi:hypothetical protein
MTTAIGTVYFHYHQDKVIYETDVNDHIIAEYTWDAEGHPVTMTKNGQTYYYHLNVLLSFKWSWRCRCVNRQQWKCRGRV